MTKTNRYSRQVTLPEIGEEGQKKLTQARILIIGAGGLGCPALQYLTAAGIGTIGIIDNDIVDITNLQRQILFKTTQQDQKKVEAAEEALTALNPDITINSYAEKLTTDNALSIMGNYDIIIDGTDNFPAKFLINDAAVKLGKPVIYGSILGFEGQAAVFWASDKTPCYRCLHPKPPSSYVPNCAESGVIGALAGIIGSIQAMEAIKLAVNHEKLKPLTGKLWLIDSRTMETNNFNIPKNPDCPVCSKKPEEIEMTNEAENCAIITDISVTEAKAKNKPDCVFIDVREQDEWDAGHIENALHCPLSLLTEQTPIDIPEGKESIIYCRSGMRSQKAIQILTARGHNNLTNLTGGFMAWCAHQPEEAQ